MYYQHSDLKNIFLFCSKALSAVLVLSYAIGNPCLATNFDMNESTSTASNAAPAAAVGIINRSGGTGQGLNGNISNGNTNLSFSDFGYSNDSNPRSKDGSNPADLLPISQQNTVTTNTGQQLQINNYAQSQVVGVTGTNSIQTPNTGQISPWAGARGSLQPVSSALQATMMPNAFKPIAAQSGKNDNLNFNHETFGFGAQSYNVYQGMYGGQGLPMPNPLGTSAGLGNSNSLPPVSTGSVDFNIVSK